MKPVLSTLIREHPVYSKRNPSLWALLSIGLLAIMLSACGPNKHIGFQAYLTNPGGEPLTGTHDITFKIYTLNPLTLDYEEQFSETQNDVEVQGGLMNAAIGAATANGVDPAIFAQPAELEIIIDGETLTPRQPLLGAPYAMTLTGGAVVVSPHDDSDPNYGSLSVVASSSGNALVVGASDSNADLIRGCQGAIGGGRSCPNLNFQVKGSGAIVSAATTKVYANPYAIIPATFDAGVLTVNKAGGSYASVATVATGQRFVYAPVDVPGTLYGTQFTLASAEVCYKVDNAASYIDSTYVRIIEGTGGTTQVAENTNRTSTSHQCYTVTVDKPVSGSVYLAFDLEYSSTAHGIYIGRITLNLAQ